MSITATKETVTWYGAPEIMLLKCDAKCVEFIMSKKGKSFKVRATCGTGADAGRDEVIRVLLENDVVIWLKMFGITAEDTSGLNLNHIKITTAAAPFTVRTSMASVRAISDELLVKLLRSRYEQECGRCEAPAGTVEGPAQIGTESRQGPAAEVAAKVETSGGDSTSTIMAHLGRLEANIDRVAANAAAMEEFAREVIREAGREANKGNDDDDDGDSEDDESEDDESEDDCGLRQMLEVSQVNAREAGAAAAKTVAVEVAAGMTKWTQMMLDTMAKLHSDVLEKLVASQRDNALVAVTVAAQSAALERLEAEVAALTRVNAETDSRQPAASRRSHARFECGGRCELHKISPMSDSRK